MACIPIVPPLFYHHRPACSGNLKSTSSTLIRVSILEIVSCVCVCSILGIPDGLPKQRSLVRLQAKFLLHGCLVAVVEPCRQSQCRACQVYILCDQAGVHKVIGFLNLRVIQPGFLKTGTLEPFEINHVDQAYGRLCPGLPRPARSPDCGCRRLPPGSACEHPAHINKFLLPWPHRHDLLGIARRSSRPAWAAKRSPGAVDPLRRPQDLRQGLKRDTFIAYRPAGPSCFQGFKNAPSFIKNRLRQGNRL